MALTATVRLDSAQADGTRNVWLDFTHASGERLMIKRRLQASDNAQTIADAMAADVEQQAIDDEHERIARDASRLDQDPEVATLTYSTRAQTRRRFIRRYVNMMQNISASERNGLELRQSARHFLNYSNAEIANATGWTIPQVVAIRDAVIAFRDAWNDMRHGNGDLG